MEDLFSWLSKFTPTSSAFILFVILIIVLLVRFKDIFAFVKWVTKRSPARSCGDCILIMFGIREKYETESEQISHSILRLQMSYFEQKIQELLLWLVQSYQDDLELLGKDKPGEIKAQQFGYYQEAIKCALLAVKDEMRKAFKENGFIEFSDNEFSIYVKSKLRTLISIAKSYLTTYYFQNTDTIVTLKYRFEKLDFNHLNDLAFDVFGYARNIVKEMKLKESEIKENFKKEIDVFIEKNKN